MIFDIRPFKHTGGASVDEQDIAKRLMDYGFTPHGLVPRSGDDDGGADRE